MDQNALQNSSTGIAEPRSRVAQPTLPLQGGNAFALPVPAPEHSLRLVGYDFSSSTVIVGHNLETNTQTSIASVLPLEMRKAFISQGGAKLN